MEQLKEKVKFWTLFFGVLQITVGCIVGLIPPHAVEWFRGIVMAHIEFTANGVLMIAFGFLVTHLKLSSRSLKAWFVLLQMGTWANGAAGVAAAFLGTSSVLMTTLNEKFPPPHAGDHPLVSGLLKTCGVTVLLALFITLYGLLKGYKTTQKAKLGS